MTEEEKELNNVKAVGKPNQPKPKVHILKSVGPDDQVITVCNTQLMVTSSDLTDEPVTCKKCLRYPK